jgi:hypothetical protein
VSDASGAMKRRKGMDKPRNKPDYWMVVFVVILLTIVPQIGRMVFPKQQGILFSALYGAIGGGLGALLYAIVKNRKTIYKVAVLISAVLIAFGSLFFVANYKSDKELVKRPWETHSFGSVSFQYPSKFTELELETDADNQNYTMRIFSDNDNERVALCLLYDFASDNPKMEDSLSGSMLGALQNMNATDVEWFDTIAGEKTLGTKVKYKIGGTDYVGYGFIYNNDMHYESVYFIPYSKKYPEEFLDRIIKNIQVNEGNN